FGSQAAPRPGLLSEPCSTSCPILTTQRQARARFRGDAHKKRSARATKKVRAKRAGAKHHQGTSPKARTGKQTITGKAGAVVAHAVTTVRNALVGAATGAATGAVTGAVHGAMTAVIPEPAPAGTPIGGRRSSERTVHSGQVTSVERP